MRFFFHGLHDTAKKGDVLKKTKHSLREMLNDLALEKEKERKEKEKEDDSLHQSRVFFEPLILSSDLPDSMFEEATNIPLTPLKKNVVSREMEQTQSMPETPLPLSLPQTPQHVASDCSSFESAPMSFERAAQDKPNLSLKKRARLEFVCNSENTRIFQQCFSVPEQRAKHPKEKVKENDLVEQVTLTTLWIFLESRKKLLCVCCKRREVKNVVTIWAFKRNCETFEKYDSIVCEFQSKLVVAEQSKIISGSLKLRNVFVPTQSGVRVFETSGFLHSSETSSEEFISSFVDHLVTALEWLKSKKVVYPWMASLVSFEEINNPKRKATFLRKSLDGVEVPIIKRQKFCIELYEKKVFVDGVAKRGHKIRYLEKLSNMSLESLFEELSIRK